jgi:hypothetical protein
MSGGSSGGGSSSSLDPAMRDAFLANAQRATGVAENLGARQFAGYNPAQADALRLSQQFSNPNSQAFQNVGSAASMTQAAGDNGFERVNAANLNRGAVRDINAERIAAERIAADRVSGANVTSEALGQIAPQARANIRDVNASSFLNQNIQQYMNPYTQQVVDTSLADLERSRQLAQQQGAAQAVRAKAFGGSRQGVAEAETNRAFADQAARTSAGLRSQGFDTASGLAQADLARQMQAQQLNQAQDAATTQQSLALSGQFGLANQQAALEAARANQATGLTASQSNQATGLQAQTANQGMDFNVGQMNTQLAQQAALANQQAGLQANQQRLAAAGQLAGIGGQQQTMGFAGANQMLGIGNQAQAQTQAQLDAARNLELERQQIINQALGLNVGGGSGAISTSAQESRQGLLGVLGL